jgi:hypothetical protein
VETKQTEGEDSQGKNPRMICWVRDLLPDDIPDASRPNTRVFFYSYDTYWQRDAVDARLATLGRDMLHAISSQIRTTEEVRETISRPQIYILMTMSLDRSKVEAWCLLRTVTVALSSNK